MSPTQNAMLSTTDAALPERRDRSRAGARTIECTLLELVEAIGEQTEDEREVVATVVHLLRSGRVRLCGNFRGVPIDTFLS